MDKKYRFFYHYRRQTKGMTVHFRGKCLPVKNVQCEVPCETKWDEKRQPNLVMRGWAHNVTITDNGLAIIE